MHITVLYQWKATIIYFIGYIKWMTTKPNLFYHEVLFDLRNNPSSHPHYIPVWCGMCQSFRNCSCHLSVSYPFMQQTKKKIKFLSFNLYFLNFLNMSCFIKSFWFKFFALLFSITLSWKIMVLFWSHLADIKGEKKSVAVWLLCCFGWSVDEWNLTSNLLGHIAYNFYGSKTLVILTIDFNHSFFPPYMIKSTAKLCLPDSSDFTNFFFCSGKSFMQ